MKPIVYYATNSVVIKFLKEDVMIDSIKSFLQIDKNAAWKLSFVHIFLNIIHNI